MNQMREELVRLLDSQGEFKWVKSDWPRRPGAYFYAKYTSRPEPSIARHALMRRTTARTKLFHPLGLSIPPDLLVRDRAGLLSRGDHGFTSAS